ncbi:MAG: ribulose-phosphate 3-epimerase [Deltaproteobacteria bacterium]|nr:ribulose-phosphate 3-epimerase [Deltaproteobacteria bacterium]
MSIIAPSILAADFGNLKSEAERVVAAGADWIHVDVMDGHFVPPITFGPIAVEALRRATRVPLDVHLMVESPQRHFQQFVEAGADRLTVQVEACPDLLGTIREIRNFGKAVGVAVNPETPLERVEAFLPEIDLLLVMTVNPGWGGQPFIRSVLPKIAEAKKLIDRSSRQILLQVDGGINAATAAECRAQGAGVFVCGTSIFRTEDYARAIHAIRGSASS